MAFDPKSPSNLILVSTPSNTNPTAAQTQPGPTSTTTTTAISDCTLVSFRADDGIGCNTEETSALIGLLDARDRHETGDDDDGEPNDDDHDGSPRSLSRLYRRELVSCIERWENRLMDSAKTTTQKEEDVLNLVLLKMTHTVTHLSEIYLLSESLSSYYEDGIDMVEEDPTRNTAGMVTADTVRYLRWNHMDDVVDLVQRGMLPEGMDVDALLRLDQPEYYGSTTDTNGGIKLYWFLFRKLVLRGRLQEAWSVLSHHSACRRCAKLNQDDFDDTVDDYRYRDPTILEDAEAFEWIETLLSSAPLPGGRDDCDDTFGSGSAGREEGEEDELNGIPTSAYRLCATNTTNNTNNIGQHLGEFNIHATMSYYKAWKESLTRTLKTNTQVQNLTRRIPSLQRYLWDILSGGYGTATGTTPDDSWAEVLVAELLYARPNLRMEDVHVRARAAMTLCRNNVRAGEGGERDASLQDIVIAFMRGNTGVVVEALHGLGGGSGAALPATMLALLCNIFTNLNKINPSNLSYDLPTELLLSASSAILSSFTARNHTDTGVSLSTRLLKPHILPPPITNTNTNIHNNDDGFDINEDITPTTTTGNIDINESSTRICAHVAESLERHYPESDAEAKILMNFCQKSVKAGSRRMLDACDGLAFARYSSYTKKGIMGPATYWLLRGVEYAAMLGMGSGGSDGDLRGGGDCSVRNAPCFRHLVGVCHRATVMLLDALVTYNSCMYVDDDKISGEEDEKVDDNVATMQDRASGLLLHTLQSTRDILQAITEDNATAYLLIATTDNNDSKSDIRNTHHHHYHPSIPLLQHVEAISNASLEGNRKKIALEITKCMEERLRRGDGLDGAVTTLAPPNLFGYFFEMAFDLLVVEDDGGDGGAGDDVEESSSLSASPSFAVHGIHTLMSRYAQYCALLENGLVTELMMTGGGDARAVCQDITDVEMFEALGKGLMRAFIAQNAEIKKSGSPVNNASPGKTTTTRTIIDVEREEYNLQLLLEPSM